MKTFEPFSLTHGVVLACFAALTATLVALRRRWRDAPRGPRLDHFLAAVALMASLAVNTWPLLPWNFEWRWSLPIHVCDVATLCVPFALATHHRPVRALLYFWGLGLSTQGFVTPDLQDGPARVGFWMFWLAHYSVVGGALYDVAARGYRPTWKDYRTALGVGLAYVTLVLPFDIHFAVNYGYVGPATPGRPTIVDVLGPWPWRVGVMVALGAAAMALLMLPWEIARRLTPEGRKDIAHGASPGALEPVTRSGSPGEA